MYIEILKGLIGISILFYASLLDWKYREIDDKSWLSLVAFGTLFVTYEATSDIGKIVPFLLSIAFTSILMVALYYPGILNGGDAKILIGISALIPTPYRDTLFPFFSMSVFANAVMLSSLLPIAFLLYNLRELKKVRNFKDFVVLFLGYKKKGDNVGRHEAIIAKNGEYCFFISGRKAELGVKAEGEVWVSPAIPFIIPITLGFLISLIFGDILSYLLNTTLK
jgi:preflagellin peptidase FlaK